MRSLALLATILAGLATPAAAQQVQSRLYDVTRSRVLRVCIYPGYYAIAFRDPASGKLTGIDVDLSQELGKELGAEVKYVETRFGTFIADLQSNKCEIGMFGIGITLKRAEAVAFTTPYLQTGIYAVTRKGGKIASWADIDRPGNSVAVLLGSYIEPFMKAYLKNAKVVSVAPPATREQELMSRRVDAEIVDYPTAQKVTADFDWATIVEPLEKLLATPFAYVVPQGDQIWLNYLNLFVEAIKRDGRLAAAAQRNNLGPIVAP